MKKLKTAIAIVLSLLLLPMAVACGEHIDPPDGLSVNEEDLLTWNEVEGARSYLLSILAVGEETAKEETLRRASYSLSSLTEGDYEIKVMALGGRENSLRSGWSETLSFRKLYGSGVVYALNDLGTEYILKQAGSASGTVVIEDEYRGKPVTAIEAAAFRACGRVEKIVIGANVKTIGDNAFYQCPRLTSVEIPDSVVSIGANAFQGCTALSSVRLPSGLQVIPNNAFAYCTSLKEIELGSVVMIGESAFLSTQLEEVRLPDSVVYVGARAFSTINDDTVMAEVSFGSGLAYLGEHAFSNRRGLARLEFSPTQALTIDTRAFQSCTALREVDLPEGLTAIGSYAFYQCTALDRVGLPESLEEIGAYAFSGCGALDDIEIPEAVTSVGEHAFYLTGLYARQVADEESGGFVYADDWLVSVTQAGKEALGTVPETQFQTGIVGIAAQTFVASPDLSVVNLPSSVKYVGDYAFYNCPKLYAFITNERGSSLRSIGEAAFANCGALANIRLHDGLLSIGAFAFMNCLAVTNNETYPYLLVPETVESIGQRAFYGTDLWNNPKEENNGVIYAGKWVVGYGDIRQSEVELIEDAEGIADFAFASCAALSGVQNLSNVSHIGVGAFQGCTALVSLSLPRSLETIEPQTFYGCSSLFSVGSTLPRTLRTVGDLAFAQCTTMESLDFSPTQVESVGLGAFWGCSSLNTITFDERLETIDDYAFFSCYSLTSLTLPASVKTIGERSFGWCLMLEDVTFGEGLERIGAFAFRNCESLTKIALPASVEEVGDYAFFRCSSVKELSLGEGLVRIGACAFSGLGIGQVVLPASVKEIGANAFRDCTQLTNVVMLGEIDYIGAHAFYNCIDLTVYAAMPLSAAAGWDESWNSSYRPVFWNCGLSEEGVVLSVNVSDVSYPHPDPLYGCSSPVREGYDFLGWTASPDATEPEYDQDGWSEAPQDAVLYAVYAPIGE